MTNRKLKNIREFIHVSSKSEYLYYVPSLENIFINLNSRSALARNALLRDLNNLCKKMKIQQLVTIYDENNKQIFKQLADDIQKCSNWTGPRLNILKRTQRVIDDTKKVILN